MLSLLIFPISSSHAGLKDWLKNIFQLSKLAEIAKPLIETPGGIIEDPNSQLKISGELSRAYKLFERGQYEELSRYLASKIIEFQKQGEKEFLIKVEIETDMKSVGSVIKIIESNNGKVIITYKNLLNAWLSFNSLPELSRYPITLTRVFEPVDADEGSEGNTDTAIINEGVNEILAQVWHEKGYNGSGVKIAIIESSGFLGYEDRQTIGELSQNIITASFGIEFGKNAKNHGTKCAEIIHDVAPNAELYLIRFSGKVGLLSAIDFLIETGVDIVSSSVIYLTGGPNDGSSKISQKITEAINSGITWVNASGNEAKLHWEGHFNDNGSGFHAWGDGDIAQSFDVQFHKCFTAVLVWNDWGIDEFGYPSGSATGQDYVLRLLHNGEVVDESSGGGDFSYAFVSQTVEEPGEYEIQVEAVNNTGGPEYLDLYMDRRHPLEYAVPEGSIPIMADALGAVTVGAVNKWHQLKDYSGRGPTNAVGGGAPDDTSRIKPDLVAPTDLTTWAGNFGGTSAATPLVAGAAALVKQGFGYDDPAVIKNYLEQSTTGIGEYPPEKNNFVGYGMLQLNDPSVIGTGPIAIKTYPNEIGKSYEGTLNIYGINFVEGAEISFSSPDLDIESTTFLSSKHIRVKVKTDPAIQPGPRDIVVTNPDGQSYVGQGILTVRAGPVVTGVFPNKEEVGQSREIKIYGSGFKIDWGSGVSKCSVSLGEGIEVSNGIHGSEMISASISISPDAEIGFRDITVSCPGEGESVSNNAFEILSEPPKPVVDVIMSSEVQPGWSGKVSVIGEYFRSDTTVDFGEGVTVQDIEFGMTSFTFSGTEISEAKDVLNVMIDVSAYADLGPRDVTVSNNGVETVYESKFSVWPKLVFTSITPGKVPSGWAGVVTVCGDGFKEGVLLNLDILEVTSYDYYDLPSCFKVQANAIVLEGGGSSGNTPIVANPDGEYALLGDNFTVSGYLIIFLSSIEPNEVASRWSGEIQITGDNFLPGLSATLTSPAGESLSADDINIESAQEATAHFVIPSGSTPGKWDISVANLNGTPEILEDALEVQVLESADLTTWKTITDVFPYDTSTIVEDGLEAVLPLPEIFSVDPDSVVQGWTGGVVIGGDHFPGSSKVKLTKTGQQAIHTYNIQVVSPNQIICQINIPQDAGVGDWTVVVVDQYRRQATLQDAIEIKPIPSIINIPIPDLQ